MSLEVQYGSVPFSVLDPDPDPTFHFDADPDSDPDSILSFTHVGKI